jgi:hypothetical protein
MRSWLAVAVTVVLGSARPALAGATDRVTDRFVAWLAAHPEVQTVSVVSEAALTDPYSSRFHPSPPSQLPSGARIRIVDAKGSLMCLTRGPSRVCTRGPSAPHEWTLYEFSRDDARGREEVLFLGPLPDRRAALFDFRLPAGDVRGAEGLRMNPRWTEPPHPGPWWVFRRESPDAGNMRAALRKTLTLATVSDAPDWANDAAGFSVFATGDPKVLRLETTTDVGLCVRGAARWVCRPLPPLSLDQVHPDLPPTDERLRPQVPVIYAARAAVQGDLITVALERHWIRSKVARTPGREWTGTFVELVELRPGASAFSRRAAMELTYGGLMALADPSKSGFPAIDALVATPKQTWCLDVVASGVIPRKMQTVPLGRYCEAAD